MLIGAITAASGASITLVESSRAAETDFEQHDVGRMLREQAKGRRGLDFEDRDRLAGIGPLAMFERGAQFVVVRPARRHRRGRGESIR